MITEKYMSVKCSFLAVCRTENDPEQTAHRLAAEKTAGKQPLFYLFSAQRHIQHHHREKARHHAERAQMGMLAEIRFRN